MVRLKNHLHTEAKGNSKMAEHRGIFSPSPLADIYVILYRAGGPYGVRPEASGRTQDQGHSFSHTDRPSPVNNMFIFFPAVNWFYRLQMGLFTQLLPLNRLAHRLLTICKKSWQRVNNSDSRERKMY